MIMWKLHIASSTVGLSSKEANVTNRDRFRESTPELSTSLSVLFSVVEDAHRYEGYLKDNAQEQIYDHELAEFLVDLRDETASRAKRAEELLAQRLADGGVH
jgi:heme oxygenase